MGWCLRSLSFYPINLINHSLTFLPVKSLLNCILTNKVTISIRIGLLAFPPQTGWEGPIRFRKKQIHKLKILILIWSYLISALRFAHCRHKHCSNSLDRVYLSNKLPVMQFYSIGRNEISNKSKQESRTNWAEQLTSAGQNKLKW